MNISKYMRKIGGAVIIIGIIAANSSIARAESPEETKAYFKSIQGKWAGKGEVVNGKYKNTKFKCELTGKTPKKLGMEIKGFCRIGLIYQTITATIIKNKGYYKGKFLGGAKGNGLDVVGGRLRNKRFTAALTRKKINGTIIIDATKKNKMDIILTVEFKGNLYPIVELAMQREKKKRGLPSR